MLPGHSCLCRLHRHRYNYLFFPRFLPFSSYLPTQHRYLFLSIPLVIINVLLVFFLFSIFRLYIFVFIPLVVICFPRCLYFFLIFHSNHFLFFFPLSSSLFLVFFIFLVLPTLPFPFYSLCRYLCFPIVLPFFFYLLPHPYRFHSSSFISFFSFFYPSTCPSFFVFVFAFFRRLPLPPRQPSLPQT